MKEPNWSLICIQLRAKYKNLDAVAKEIGSSWYTLNQIARGDVIQPKWLVGQKLLELHAEHCDVLTEYSI